MLGERGLIEGLKMKLNVSYVNYGGGLWGDG